MGSLFGGRRGVLGAAGALGLAAALAGGAAIAQGGSAGAQQAITVTGAASGPMVGGANAGTLQEGFVRVSLSAPGGGFVGVARLKPGATPEQVVAFARARPNGVPDRLISIVTSQFANPGEGAFNTTVRLADGNYLAFSQAGAPGPNAPTAPLRVAPFSVADTAAPGVAPASGARVLMYDHGFRAPARIAGDGVLRVRNIGKSNHFIVGIRLNRPADARRVSRAFRGEIPPPEGPPPGQFGALLGIVSPNTDNRIETDLRPGRYVLACFFSDRASAGREHAEFGMVRTLTVT